MTINRNGINIELTQDEMYQAYYEQQRNFDVEDIAMTIVDKLYDGEIKPLTDDIETEAHAVAEELVDQYRETIDGNTNICDTEWYIRHSMIEERYGG